MKSNKAWRLLHIISLPVKAVSHALHLVVPHNRRVSRFLIGIIVIFAGSLLAEVEQHVFPKFIWDALAWLIHGIGSAPIVEGALKRLAAKELE